MSCFQFASAIVRSGTTGYVLIVKVIVFAGIVPPTLEKGIPPFDPENIFPVIINRSVPSSVTQVELEVTQNLSRKDEFASIEIFCGDVKPGTIIPVSIE